MCVCPISVKNKKLDFDPLVDRFYNYVPCGKCHECQESIRNGYEVRLLFEFYHNKKIGGCCYYATLTYNDSSIPYVPGTSVKCFSKRHIQLFIKRFRKFSHSFKYFCVAEVGHKTFRPHYHIIFFFDKPINWFIFNQFLVKSWTYGFTYLSLNHGLVTDIRPFSYVAKYCVKDVLFDKYLRKYESLPAVVDFLQKSSYYNVDLYPFNLHSNNLGIDIINYLLDTDYVKGYFIANDVLGLNRKLSIPLFILRRKLYDTYTNINGTISYKLNDYGKKIFYKKMLYQYSKLSTDYKFLFSVGKNVSLYDSSIFIKKYFPFDYWCKVCDFYSDKKKVDYLVRFKLLYSDLLYVPFSFASFREDLQIFIDCVFSPSWCNFQFNQKHVIPFEVDCKILINCLTDIQTYFRYQNYQRNVVNYNCNQLHRSFKTAEKKLKYMCTLEEFRNNNNLKSIYYVRLSKEVQSSQIGFYGSLPSLCLPSAS